MANTKISQLTALTNPTGNEELVYAYNNSNGKMSVNTMKTFIGSWKQDTLVSWTNIKTINWQSLLWSWNITIWWWGGWTEETGYDCIVDAAGNGDYTTITAALADGNRSMLILPWTYNETEWNTVADTDRLILHGIDRVSTVINVTLSSDGYFIKHTWSQAGTVTEDIRNLTINMTCNKSTSNFIDWYTTDASKYVDITMDNCTVNITSWINCWAYIFRIFSDDNNKVLINNSNINLTDGWYYISLDDGSACNYTNCKFYLSATWSRTALDIRNLNNCKVWWKATDSWWTYTYISNVVDSVIKIRDNQSLQKWRMHVSNARNTEMEIHYWAHPSTDISWSTVIPDWATSTSYSVWDYVRWNWDMLECIEAHTSQDSAPWQDEEKWNYVNALTVGWEIEWCNIRLWSGSNNSFIALYWDTNFYNTDKFENNIIQEDKIFAWWNIMLNWNSIIATFLQDRAWTSVISWNRMFSSTGWCTLYYADNYSLIQNNMVAGWTATWAITVLWTATSTSTVDNNLLFDARSL